MKAWVVEEIVDPARMRLAEVPRPVPTADQLLVRVEAAGLNFLDTLVIKGQYQAKPALPFTPGVEVVGRVVGNGGEGLPADTRVACSTPVGRFGGFAEYAVVPAAEVVVLDETIPAGAALALRGNYPTSLYALRHAGRLAKGETLLVHAGAGGVGSAAVQLGKRFGARVIATAGSASKLEACRLLGADVALDYTTSSWVAEVRRLAPEGVDVVYDPVGGETGVQSLRCLAFGARYLVIGFAGGALTQLPANRLLLQNASAVGVLWGAVRKRDPLLSSRLTDEVYAAYRAGEIEPLKTPTFPFDKAPEALEALEGRQTAGKTVLLMDHGLE
jgi:NADPH:quinone reductase